MGGGGQRLVHYSTPFSVFHKLFLVPSGMRVTKKNGASEFAWVRWYEFLLVNLKVFRMVVLDGIWVTGYSSSAKNIPTVVLCVVLIFYFMPTEDVVFAVIENAALAYVGQ